MPIHQCRVCGQGFFKEPLLHFENMPKTAQNFPGAHSLKGETGVPLTVLQCSGCGLIQLASEPVSYYREVIRAAAFSESVKAFKLKQFEDFLQTYSLYGKKIIEIGCGRGEFLSLLQSLDVEAYGVEFSETAVAHCVQNGLRVSRGYPGSRTPVLGGGPFDAFLLLMFLEHMPEPNVSLRAIHDHLKEGAMGLVEVPNFDMKLQDKLFSEFTSDHLLYFSRKTLESVLSLNGFEIIECRETRDHYVLSAVVRKRGRLDISSFTGAQMKIKNEIDGYLGRFGDKKVAVWGAGHQALAVLALTGIAGKIKYVVDSATFKQGKFTPATHIPVVSPEALRSDPVEAVIVMAASYSDEVAGILREQFGSAVAVAILRNSGLETV